MYLSLLTETFPQILNVTFRPGSTASEGCLLYEANNDEFPEGRRIQLSKLN